MGIEHIARSGKTYYLHKIIGAQGKEKYFFSTKSDGILVQAVPDGYEIYENIDAQVFLRRRKKQLIQQDEFDLIQVEINKKKDSWKYKGEIKNNMIIIHEACQECDWLEILSPWVNKAKVEQMERQIAKYLSVMQFVLINDEERTFQAERYCFRGSIDGWISIGFPDKLNLLANKLISRLGQESFYELM